MKTRPYFYCKIHKAITYLGILVCLIVPNSSDAAIFTDYISVTNICDGTFGEITVSDNLFPYTYIWLDTNTSGSRYNLNAGVYSVVVMLHNGCVEFYDIPIVDITNGCDIVFDVQYDEDYCSGEITASYFSNGIELSPASYAVYWLDGLYPYMRTRPFEVGVFSYDICAEVFLSTSITGKCCIGDSGCATIIANNNCRLKFSSIDEPMSHYVGQMKKHENLNNGIIIESPDLERLFVFDAQKCGGSVDFSGEKLSIRITGFEDRLGENYKNDTEDQIYYHVKFKEVDFWKNIKNGSFLIFDFKLENLSTKKSEYIYLGDKLSTYVNIFDDELFETFITRDGNGLDQDDIKLTNYIRSRLPYNMGSSTIAIKRSDVLHDKSIYVDFEINEEPLVNLKEPFKSQIEESLFQDYYNKTFIGKHHIDVETVIVYLNSCKNKARISSIEISPTSDTPKRPISNQNDLQVYPNPYKDEFVVRIESSESGISTLIIMDLLGVIHHKEDLILNANNYSETVQRPRLKPGINIIQVTYPDGQIVTKQIIRID